MNKGQLLKLIAGESIGVVTVQMRQRDSETKRIVIDEKVRLEFDKTSVTMVASDEPASLYRGAKLDLSDLRSDIVLHLGLTRKQEWFRRVLQRHFRAELKEYREMLRNLSAVNLDPVMPRHFFAKCPGVGCFRRQTEYGYLVISREIDSRGLVAFTLVSAPHEHPITEARGEMGVTVVYDDGEPLKKPDQTLAQTLFFEALSSFGKVTTTVTVW